MRFRIQLEDYGVCQELTDFGDYLFFKIWLPMIL